MESSTAIKGSATGDFRGRECHIVVTTAMGGVPSGGSGCHSGGGGVGVGGRVQGDPPKVRVKWVTHRVAMPSLRPKIVCYMRYFLYIVLYALLPAPSRNRPRLRYGVRPATQHNVNKKSGLRMAHAPL